MRFLWVLVFFTLSACSSGEKHAAANDSAMDVESSSDISEESTADAEECWWCVDTSTPDVAPTTGEGGKEGGKGDGKEAGALRMTWKGIWSDADRQGSMDISISTDDGKTLLCDYSYPIASSSQNDSCSECTFAWTFTLSEPTIDMDGDSCSILAGTAEAEENFGHGDPNALYALKGDDWAQIDNATSTHGDGSWEFEFSYDFGATGDKGGGEGGKPGLDEGCYDACIAKGETDETCSAACGGGDDGKDDSSEGGDTGTSQSGVDQACYDACIAKGASEDVCTEACPSSDSGGDDRRGDDGK